MTGFNVASVSAIALGASAGACLRWWLSLRLNVPGAAISIGTLAANSIGAYVVGVAIAFLQNHPDIHPQWRLVLITGFCGGLTTFSTFSAEVVLLLQQDRLAAAMVSTLAHVSVSLLLTWTGLQSIRWLGVS